MMQSWKTKNKFRVQAVALVLITAGSFGVYFALNAGWDIVAVILFGLVTLGYGLTIWVS